MQPAGWLGALTIFACALGWPAAFIVLLACECPKIGESQRQTQAGEHTNAPVVTTYDPAIVSRDGGPTSSLSNDERKSVLLSPEQARASVGRTARAIVEALDRRDYAAVSAHVSPLLGVALAPRLRSWPELSVEELRDCARDPRKRSWGDDPPSTCADFLTRLTGFAGATLISYDDDIRYPWFAELRRAQPDTAIFVQYSVVKYLGNSAEDRSLVLAFRPEGDQWTLAAIGWSE
jgi:hypothetical protein